MVCGCTVVRQVMRFHNAQTVSSHKKKIFKQTSSFQKVSVTDLLSLSTLYPWCHFEEKYYRGKNFHTTTICIWCGTHLALVF